MIIKSFFDGGNKADSTQYDVVSLAVVSGRIDQWKGFEKDWNQTLRKHGAPWLHTTDAVTFNGPFRRDAGWNKEGRDKFVADCVRVVGTHIALPIKSNFPGRDGLLPFAVTVVLEDFKRARAANPNVPKDVTEILATQALNACLEWGRSREAHFYHLFFDQSEPYRGHVSDRQRNPKAVKQVPLMERVILKPEADMRQVPALQMADLFAWCVSHKHQPPHEWQRELLNLPRLDEWIEYNNLVNPIPGVVELVKKWKLPLRRPTR